MVRNSIEFNVPATDFSSATKNAEAETTQGAAQEDTTPTFNEAKDRFGNALTETTFTDGNFGTIYRSFRFNEDDYCMAGDDAGNNLIE